MERLAKLTGKLRGRLGFAPPQRELEPINARPREMVGLFALLSHEQKAEVLNYSGPENHGDKELRKPRS